MVQSTGVPEDTILAFKDLYFESDVFKNRLLRTAFVQRLHGGTEDEEFHRDMLTWASKLGWEYVEWRVTGQNSSLPIVTMLKGLLSDSLWRCKEHLFSSINAPTAKEARAWLPHTIRLAEAVANLDNNRISSIEELRIELSGLDVTISRDKLGAEIELHSVSPT